MTRFPTRAMLATTMAAGVGGTALAWVVAAASDLCTSGDEKWLPLLLAGVWLLFWYDIASSWFGGGADPLLVSAVTSLAAVVAASSWRPVARVLDRLAA